MDKIKPVLCVVTSNDKMGSTDIPTGLWLTELIHPISQFLKYGIDYDIASINGGVPPVDPHSAAMKDEICDMFMKDDIFMNRFNNTKRIDDVKSSDYSAVLYVGGHGPLWDFPNNQSIHRITREIYENGDIVAAVCHGPCALFNVQLSNNDYLVKDKNLVSFTNEEEIESKTLDIVPFSLETALSNHKTHFMGKPNWSDNVIVDGNLITGQNPQSALTLGEVIASILSKD